jgi:uncharacterized membrane protein
VSGLSPAAGVDRVKSSRLVEVDRVRGLAIMLMLVDHVAYIAGPVELRMTVGRAAMPLFMLLGGALATRLTWRHGLALGIGGALTVVAPWAGEPNILVQYVLGVFLLVCLRWAELTPWVALVAAGVSVSNGWSDDAWSYEQVGIFALMACGALLGLGWAVRLGGVLPAFLGPVGAAPLRWYVGNVLAIQGVIWWLSRA